MTAELHSQEEELFTRLRNAFVDGTAVLIRVEVDGQEKAAVGRLLPTDGGDAVMVPMALLMDEQIAEDLEPPTD